MAQSEQNADDTADTDSEAALTLTVALPDDESASVRIEHVAGKNMWGFNPLDDPDSVAERLGTLDAGDPVMIAGGGNLGGPTPSIGRFTNAERDGDDVRVAYEPVLKLVSDSQTKVMTHASLDAPLSGEQTRRLGSWELYLPADTDDSEALSKALDAFADGATDYFLLSNREEAALGAAKRKEFRNLSPGDRIETGAYSTPLVVLSDPYGTYIGSRGFKIRSEGVTYSEGIGVTVSNPRGGYYQLGIKTDGQDGPPTYYIGRSKKTPPAPNTAFVADSVFGAEEFEVLESGAEDVDPVEPDMGLLNSPLPPKSVQTPLTDIDGVGEKTRKRLLKDVGAGVTAHTAALALYGDPDAADIDFDGDTIRNVLDSLPKKESVYTRLRNIYDTEIDG